MTPSSVVFDSGSAIDVVRTRRDDDVKDDGFNVGFSAHQRSPKRFVVDDDVGFRRARRVVVEIGPDRAVATTTAR